MFDCVPGSAFLLSYCLALRVDDGGALRVLRGLADLVVLGLVLTLALLLVHNVAGRLRLIPAHAVLEGRAHLTLHQILGNKKKTFV